MVPKPAVLDSPGPYEKYKISGLPRWHRGKEVKWNESRSVMSDFATPWTITQVSLSANAGNIRDEGSVPGWGRAPGRGHGNPL